MASETSASAKATASNRSVSCLGSICLILSDEADNLGERTFDVEGSLGLRRLPAAVGVHEQAMQGVLTRGERAGRLGSHIPL